MTKTRTDRRSTFARRRETGPLRRHALAGQGQLDSPGASDVGVAVNGPLALTELPASSRRGARSRHGQRDQRIAIMGEAVRPEDSVGATPHFIDKRKTKKPGAGPTGAAVTTGS